MDKKILGIDFSDNGILLSFYSDERKWYYPAAVSRDEISHSWLIGRAAYESALNGTGIITDKLLTFLDKHKTTTLHGVSYTATELVGNFFKAIINDVCSDTDIPDEIVICVPDITMGIINSLTECINYLGIKGTNVHIISRSEAFIYYSMSQSQDFHNNNVALFSLEDNALTYYEMKTQRKPKTTLVYAEKVLMDESFNIEISNTDAGAKLADHILVSCVERLFKNKVFSAVILTGKGFQTIDWAPEFTKLICKRRKVFLDDEIFSRGAGFRGADIVSERPVFQFVPICDGRVDCSIFLTINKKDRTMAYPIINIGDPWYSIDRQVKIIPTERKEIELSVVPLDERMRRTVHVPVPFLIQRPARTTALGLGLHFSNAHVMTIDIEDLGFGDFYPSSHQKISQEVTLWG
ncbi:MAG: DUF5716 family protein [Lachnospiraceae bacterium]|nr:DUF5716 family protein [Lachnospiraceae bacterium]